jgi:hypothetical protein
MVKNNRVKIRVQKMKKGENIEQNEKQNYC